MTLLQTVYSIKPTSETAEFAVSIDVCAASGGAGVDHCDVAEALLGQSVQLIVRHSARQYLHAVVVGSVRRERESRRRELEVLYSKVADQKHEKQHSNVHKARLQLLKTHSVLWLAFMHV
ncbi:hypothetical protein EON65_22430 [archaeon]|nr:MAG: hypothetical protein EON65_22430 [archaeon]